MGLWEVKIGQGGSQRTQNRVISITVTEEFGHISFEVTIDNPIISERSQFKGRKGDAIIQITRGSDILVEGFIEDVEGGGDYVKYSGRSFLVLLGYSTSSETGSGGTTEAEYEDDSGKDIIDDLIDKYCVDKDAQIAKFIIFPEIYGGKFGLHGKKVYQITREMCQMYGYDLWSDATWSGSDVTAKNIRVGEKIRGTSTVEHKALYGGQHLKDIPTIKYRSSQAINCLRVIGGGTGKDRISEFIKDETPFPNNSITNNGYIEGEPYHNNMIRKVETAQLIGQAIINAKKDPIEELRVTLAMYINDLRYGDWVKIIDTHSNINTIKRIKKITRINNVGMADSMSIELGEKFDNYQNIIRDLTKGDVDEEPDMAMAGGSLRITANDPPSDYVRVDSGDWYGTDGILHHQDNYMCAFWQNQAIPPNDGPPPYNPTTDLYCRALVQIRDDPDLPAGYFRINYKTNLTAGSPRGYSLVYAMSDADDLVADSSFTPIGEVILKGISMAGAVDIVNAIDEGHSFIYRDARPILGGTGSGNCITGSGCPDDKNPYVCVSESGTPCQVDIVAGVGGIIIFKRLS